MHPGILQNETPGMQAETSQQRAETAVAVVEQVETVAENTHLAEQQQVPAGRQAGRHPAETVIQWQKRRQASNETQAGGRRRRRRQAGRNYRQQKRQKIQQAGNGRQAGGAGRQALFQPGTQKRWQNAGAGRQVAESNGRICRTAGSMIWVAGNGRYPVCTSSIQAMQA